MKVMSFNIKCDDTIADMLYEQLWENRKNNLVREIIELSPDIIGMQEVMSHQQEYLLSALGDIYSSVYCNRDDNAPNGEGSPVYYKKSKFDLVQSGTFWLSETPDKCASISWNSRWPRICTYVILKDKSTHKIFAHFNTHLDHKSPDARLNGIKLILSKIKQLNLPTILTGDFNSPKTESATILCENELTNANTNNDNSITFHLWGHPEVLKEGITNIDYISLSKLKSVNYKVINYTKDSLKNSDHFAIQAEIEMI